MDAAENKLVSWLFETKAVRVCPQDKPFWYTSGTIGPYYINTHFLYGSEEKANELLAFIDKEKEGFFTCPQKVLQATQLNYKNDPVYRGLIDEMCLFIKKNIPLEKVDCISGGERRDWFFSPIIAELLGKPHITIYKDLTAVITENGKTTEIDHLDGKKVLHIADLITEASSYERAWIPAIQRNGGEICWSVVVVDRKQGGEELLKAHGVQSFSMVNIDRSLFQNAMNLQRINEQQYEMLLSYLQKPKEAMASFLKAHPEFLEQALNADEKTRERARLCIEKKIYS